MLFYRIRDFVVCFCVAKIIGFISIHRFNFNFQLIEVLLDRAPNFYSKVIIMALSTGLRMT